MQDDWIVHILKFEYLSDFYNELEYNDDLLHLYTSQVLLGYEYLFKVDYIEKLDIFYFPKKMEILRIYRNMFNDTFTKMLYILDINTSPSNDLINVYFLSLIFYDSMSSELEIDSNLLYIHLLKLKNKFIDLDKFENLRLIDNLIKKNNIIA